MFLRNLDLLLERPGLFFAAVAAISLALLVAITFHEASHALAAYSLGDATARRQGRLSLNPIAHLDPVGTLMLFLVGFGWGKPVPVNPAFLRPNPRRGMALVGASGPLSNLALAGLLGLPIRTGALPWRSPFDFLLAGTGTEIAGGLLGLLIFYNIILALFNLIPVAPLDGFRVALGLLPRDSALAYARTESYGFFILIGIIFLGYFSGLDIFWRLLEPPLNFFFRIFTGGVL